MNTANLVETLRWRASRQSEKVAYTFLVDGEDRELQMTYGQLDRRARSIAALLNRHQASGQPVLLLYPSGLEYLAAFFGCLYAGAIAVPAYPPAATRSGGQLSRLYSVLKDARPRVVLTSEAIRSGAAALAGENPALKALTWIATDHQETDLAEEWQERAIAADSPAFLQYTSGSTSSPKGVIVTHGNLAHNEEMIRVAMEHTELSTFVGWLPLYHDMGLIGNVLQPLHLGAACVLMSPEAFLQRPFRWLRAISRYRAATSGGPNFAYELCARKVRPEERATLDLSCWTVAFNGAEPVRAESLERFAHAFGACGFRREAFYPCYGLAEATLLVTGARRREPPLILGLQRESLGRHLAVPGESDVQRLVSCGRSYGDQRVAIVDPSSRTELPSGRIGEIWIGGPSIAAGYWGRPEETAATFGAHLAETGEGPFLRTGDLGFLIDGELFVTGRIKDLIIIRGRNHYPQDIELTVERSYEGLRPGRGIAFSVEAGEQEGLAVIQEIDPGQDRQAGAMMERIREAIAAEHEIQVSAIALVRPGSVPKTSSGKLQRRACREAYLNRQLDPIAEWRSESEERFDPASAPAPPRTLAEVEAWLQSKVAAGLKVDRSRIDPARPLAALGVDSLVTVELMHQLETELGVGVSIADLFESRSLSGLASRICSELAPAVVAVDRAPSVISTHPLSYGQRSLFFLHRLDPADPAYNLARAMRIVGDLDPDLLRRAFHLIVERQAALRTTFTVDSGEPVQQIHAYLEPHFRRRDASSWDESRMRAELLEEANRPFDLATGPLLRLELFTSSSRGPVLLLVMHHIISDLWSFAVLIDELRAVCEALGAGRPPALRPLTLQYPDYARQQADLMAGPEGERLWNHWRRQLAGGSPALNLPVDRPRALAGESRGAVQSLRIEEPLTQALRRLSQQENVTLYMTLLAVFQGLLHRYTGQDDLLIGSPTAGRHRAEFRDLIGYFVNPVVMRADLSGDPTFKQLLDRVRRNVLETFAHQEYPFALLVERLQPDRAHRGSPLLQVMFVLQKAPSFADENLASLAIGAAGGRIRLGASRLEAIPLDQEAALFDLTLTAAEVEGGLSFSLQYRTGLFDASTIERMLAHFNALLAAVAADRESPVSAWPLPIPAGAESRPPEVEDEVAPSEFSPGLCLPQLFEAQVRLRPNQAAVSFEGEQLTYDELNRRANRLAHYLRGRGVGPEVLVGLFVERSFDLVVGILGILKAGGAYVPLDPSYSPERVALMLEDAGVALLLTEDRMRERLPELSSPVVFLDLDRRALSEQQDEDPAVLTGPAHLAYVIYTSGSTGRPKGTEVTHANVTRLFTATRAWFQFDERDVWTLFHSCAFDFSVWELWGALLHGGRLVVVSHWVSRSPEAFLELLAWESVTVLNQTPSAFRQLIYACESSAGSEDLKLRLVIFGGEALDLDGLRPWFDRYGDRHPQLVNMYGITETTVHVTYRALKREDLDRPGGSRIGRPIPDLQLHLLDSRMRPVPIGVVGEIYVGGAGVARGYLGRPDLTAGRFLHDPFTGLAESRLYRTGDLARRRPDGDLEYVGRGDEQVKIRGFRIELQEIRSTILQHPRVRDAVITVVEDSPGERRLAAYLVPQRREEPPAIDELRRYLRERLAEFMVPSFFVMLDELPLTPHGKLDRRALPPPESNRPDLTSGFSAPETETEAALAEVWARALGIERVGIDDNFFDLGGDSIRSIQVKARAEQLGLNFSLQQMFGHPTIRRLALAIAGAAPTVEPAAVTQPFSLVSARDRERLPDGLDDSYPLTKLQAGLVFHSERAVDYETYVTSLHLRMPLEMPLLQRAIDRMVSRHPILRTSFNLSSYSEPLQLVHQAASLRLKFEDLSGLSDREQESAVAEFVAAERRRRFDWTRAPLIDLQVHRRSPETLQFTLSEPFLDGWSVASLLTELFTLYFSELTGGALSEREGAPLRAGFRDYVALEQEALRSSADREYWLNRMGDYSRRSLPQGPPLSLRAVALPIERLEVPIPAPVSSAIYGFAHRARVPIKSVLLAAHLRVLSLLTGEPEVVTGLLYNGRPEVIDGDRMLGLFLNAMPMRLSLDPGTWAGLARAAFEAEQEAMPHRRYPLAELQRQGGGRPLFDAAFNFTHFHVYQNLRRIGGLEVLGGFASDQTFFDLTAQFNLDHASSRVRLALDYRAARFGREQLMAMGGYYRRVLEAMSADPNGSIWICLLSAEERNQILREWNETAIAYSETRSLPELIEQQVASTPGRDAVTFEDRTLAYDELNRRANRLAHHLQSLPAGPGTLIGLCLERSPEMVIGLLGILKAGAAYVPLDPEYPRERLALMIGDAGLKLIVTTRTLASALPVPDAIPVFIDELPAWQPETNPLHRAKPDDPAYVIYTSGSTGVPKGVGIQHRALVNFMESMRREPGLTADDTLLAVTTLSFDIAALEIFLPLVTGARVVIVSRATAVDGYALSESLSKSGATVMQATPTTWRLLLEAGWRGRDGFTALCGGEALSRELADRLLDGGCRVWNLYGPTETTIWSTVCRVDSGDEPVSIGRPIANTRIYLLDQALNPVPVGVPGELYIGGCGLASGYLNREELTAERFIRDHFATASGERLYRTGDLARYLPDGRLELLGRLDQQVKVRGYRIEPGEIEAALLQHPAVRQAAVVATEQDERGKRLIAYLVLSPGSVSAAELRDFLRERLPKYAIPASLVVLDALPLTPNGKLDRNQLSRLKARPGGPPEVEDLLRMIEGLSIAEARALLQQKRNQYRER